MLLVLVFRNSIDDAKEESSSCSSSVAVATTAGGDELCWVKFGVEIISFANCLRFDLSPPLFGSAKYASLVFVFDFVSSADNDDDSSSSVRDPVRRRSLLVNSAVPRRLVKVRNPYCWNCECFDTGSAVDVKDWVGTGRARRM